MKELFEQEYISARNSTRRFRHVNRPAQLIQNTASAEDQVNLNYTIIRSPVSGIVVDRVIDLGQTVAANADTSPDQDRAGPLRDAH